MPAPNADPDALRDEPPEPDRPHREETLSGRYRRKARKRQARKQGGSFGGVHQRHLKKPR